ncbi:outer membrane beta-barrel protein [Sunxiuqinia sp. A32]|uniref:outer membrane beta-barrel protein n=1 Tax=Sunxiuqinia sp. A32 TaxID=3461496 RepID=UPI0040462695
MKRYIFIIALMFCFTIHLKAQISHGLRAGLEVVNFTGDEVSMSNFMPVFTGGYFLNYELTESFSIQPEFNLAFKGASNDMILKGFPFSKINLTYLQIPVLFNISSEKIISGLTTSFFAGPALDIYVVQDADGEMIETDPNNTKYSLVQDPESLTYDMIFGVNLRKDDRYFIDVRYNNGIAPFYKDVDAKSMGISLSLGIFFN